MLPDDEPYEYLVTQAIAEYLSAEANPPLDGIMFPSVQAGGGQRNIALFHRSSRVQVRDLLDDTEISIRSGWTTDEGYEPDYSIREEVPDKEKEPEVPSKEIILSDFTIPSTEGPSDHREITLTLDWGSLQVHHIRGVSFDTKAYPVRHF